jgi:hypothetical protein
MLLANVLSFLTLNNYTRIHTGSLKFSILDSDNTANLACVLVHFLPATDYMSKSVHMSIIRTLCHNPQVCFVHTCIRVCVVVAHYISLPPKFTLLVCV